MTVFQLRQHIGKQIEELIATHRIRELPFVLSADNLPVDALLIKETIMLIDDAPERLKVLARACAVSVRFVTARQKQNQKDQEVGNTYFHKQPMSNSE